MCKSCSFVVLCVSLWVRLFISRGNALQHTGKSPVGILPGCVIPGYKQLIHRICIDGMQFLHICIAILRGSGMDLCWSYEKYSPNRYRLILIDKVIGCGHTLRAVWVPGYESRRLIDILQAAWYLNSGGKIRNGLADHTVLILDQIAEYRKES